MREQLRAALALKEYRWMEEAPKPSAPAEAGLKRVAAGNDQNGMKKRPVGRPSLASLHDFRPDAAQVSISQYTEPIDVDMNGNQPSSTDPPSSYAG